MKLTKQEQALVIGRLINNILGEGLVKGHIDPQKLEKVVSMYNEIYDNTTPKQERELLISVLEKTIDEFIKE
ncbi:hypothetical protein CON97_05575 [Bacillus pseudomycoides]|uniref:hypothetical protein n=1 Tax=Bacillus pseudomycoides TaxID=64104 RepID=UPI000BEC0661|nr:hypothetical protein [Bacillus pseudomycoides]PED73075.1 hypothetical protein CON97_05575 [Bacillus pseudomycoides]